MSDLEEEDTLFLQIAVFLRLNKKNESKNKWKYWVREILGKREENRAYNTLVQEMKLGDKKYYFW